MKQCSTETVEADLIRATLLTMSYQPMNALDRFQLCIHIHIYIYIYICEYVYTLLLLLLGGGIF